MGQYLIPDYLDIRCEGDSDDDVYHEYPVTGEDEDWGNSFYYANMRVLPSCQTGEVELFVQLKDGLKGFSLVLDRSFQTGDTQTLEISLE